MDVVHPKCAGLDVHQQTVVACARVVSGTTITHDVRTFGTTTVALLALGDWLGAHGCTHVAMESTGVYWKPVWHVLDGHFELVLANAMHIRNIPGRKSDVNDTTWIADLLAHGLIRSSFVPPEPVQDLRDPHPHPQAARPRDRPAHPADPENPRDRERETHRRPRRHPGRQWPGHPARARGRRD
jgi:hypothetical protein